MIGDIQTRLIDNISSSNLVEDSAQIEAAKALDSLLVQLGRYADRTWFSLKKKPPLGLYMWGGVGRGKSMLMDWFFEYAPIEQKKRVHFHEFMLSVHAKIFEWRKLDDKARKRSPNNVRGAKNDPIAAVAKDIAREAQLLCFDEFHVTNIADAMILSRLFEALWARKVIIVATSNRAPDDLYKNGLNRALFEPFIERMKEHMIIYAFSGETDHRLRQLSAAPVYYAPLGPDVDEALEDVWHRLIGSTQPRETTLIVQGRELFLPKTAAGVVWTGFDPLCVKPLGAADYLHLAKAFQTVILENIPQMSPEMRNEAKRFTLLIDALYETRTKLIMSAEVQPDKLYISGTESFEFERTVSRLMEMQGAEYLGSRRTWNIADRDL